MTVKLTRAENTWRTVDKMSRIVGDSGYLRAEDGIERMERASRIICTYDGSRKTQQIIIAR